MELIQKQDVVVAENGRTVTLTMARDHTGRYRIIIEGSTWAICPEQVSALLLYDMIRDHIAEYDF